MTQIVVGTAGHIDHGKTSLVKALTGIDTDHLNEEKARGMTIDLGFAFLNDTITIIDVPGHEKFIRNMVAGVSTIHMALLVVAADDGIMPQTREHLHILKLLKIPHGVISITKCDKVDDKEWLDLIELEIRELTDGIFQTINIIRTSVVTNLGIEELKQLLIRKSKEMIQEEDRGFFRLQGDRIFSVTGFGTVVTGTVISGQLKKGDVVEVLPGNIQVKVRGIQSHGVDTEYVNKGDRAAINLVGLDIVKLSRGSELVSPGKLKAIRKFTAHIQLIPDINKNLKHGQRIRIHIGTAEVMGRVFLTEKNQLTGGNSGNVIIETEQPIIAASEDRFVLRTYSPMITIGGGTVLTTFIPKSQVKQWVSMLALDRTKRFRQLVSTYKTNPKTIHEWSASLEMTDNYIRQLIKSAGLNISKHSVVYTEDNLKICRKLILEGLNNFHIQQPLRKSMGVDVLKQEIHLSELWLNEVLGIMELEGLICSVASGIALADHQVELAGGEAIQSEKIETELNQSHFIPLTTHELSNRLMINHKNTSEILHVLKDKKKVTEIENGLWMGKKNVAKLQRLILNYFSKYPSMSVAEFKERTGLTRKYAIPVLEYCDRHDYTIRDGNVRLKGENL